VPLFIALGAGVLIIALVAVFALIQPSHTTTSTSPGTNTTAGTGSATGAATTPSTQSATAADAVQGYLEALARGDSASALAYAATPPSDVSMLTDEVLAASIAAAPITGITTTPGTGSDHQSVQVGYTAGNAPVLTSFEVSQVNGTWLLDQVAAPIPLDLSAADGLALTLNGVPLTSTDALLFPGRYTVAPAVTLYSLSGAGFTLTNTTDGGQRPAATLKLSAGGTAAVRSAAQAKLTSCLKARSLAPSGCGFGTYLPGKNKVRPATIRWQATSGANAMKALKPSLFAADAATAQVSVKTRVTCSSTNGLRWRGTSSIRTVYATIASGKVSVTFGA
jgi:hypothetical protein